jgi:alkanesulfonate monooxygenase SsuD/methylene tetrahydromethanopterin reductase-like flavin-dependent oxidoreductase (luciferase family)
LTSKAPRIGVFFPSLVWPSENRSEPLEGIRGCIERCEHYGFDIWVVDHLLVAPGLYGATWLDPLVTLSYAAALTRNVWLGTAILVAPVRQPVLLAKEVASLQDLAQGRFQLGLGPGWDAKEFEAIGAHVSERGRRTDEVIEALEHLLNEQTASYEGRYYRFKDISIYPRTGMPPVWISGGSRIPDPNEHDLPTMHPNVLARIVKAGRWLARASGKQEWVKRDWDEIRKYAREHGKDPDSITFGHVNWFHLVDDRKHEDAVAKQAGPFQRMMGRHRSLEHLEECYLLGTTSEIVQRLQDLVDYGCDYICIGPTEADPAQIDKMATEIIPRLSR